eukprot:5966556-Pyramimonas_sp.AAC.1
MPGALRPPAVATAPLRPPLGERRGGPPRGPPPARACAGPGWPGVTRASCHKVSHFCASPSMM